MTDESRKATAEGLQKRIIERMTPVTESGCWLWNLCADDSGYGLIAIANRSYRAQKAHRISYEAFVGEIPDGLHVLHRCDTRLCVNPEHLYLGTNADNMKDRDTKGRGVLPDVRGVKNGKAKISNDAVKEIRIRAGQGVSQRVLASEHGLSKQHVSDIVSRKKWGHVQ